MAKIARLCLTGPESTGKTWLAGQLAARFGTVWVPEYARDYALQVARELTADDVEPIARGQIANEERALPPAGGLLVLDTDLVSTVVYSRHYYGTVPPWIEEAARQRLADLYLLLDLNVPWIADPARSSSADRPQLHAAFARTLDTFGARVVRVGGGWEERLGRAVGAVERLGQHGVRSGA